MNELEVLKNSLNVSVWMLCVTLFLSVSTVTLSALNMAFQRSHNRKSVKPFCNVHKFNDGTNLNISIMNAGLGPMIIQNIVLLKNNEEASTGGARFSEVIPRELDYNTIVNNDDSYIIPSMGELKLLEYTADPKNKKSSAGLLQSTLEDTFLCIVFKDIYDHSYEKRELLKF